MALWVDVDRLQVGEVWRDELAAVIARSRVALLLVSEHYLASAFINDHELPALITRGVVLAPVLIGDCLWRHEPLLEQRQWLHDPGREGPLNLLKSARRTQQVPSAGAMSKPFLRAIPAWRTRAHEAFGSLAS